ncbi:hypothetical protein INR49_032432 [Caranx melampygus]|nr:hypothetical protein INR49_032432 [Caranx melampygus]
MLCFYGTYLSAVTLNHLSQPQLHGVPSVVQQVALLELPAITQWTSVFCYKWSIIKHSVIVFQIKSGAHMDTETDLFLAYVMRGPRATVPTLYKMIQSDILES